MMSPLCCVRWMLLWRRWRRWWCWLVVLCTNYTMGSFVSSATIAINCMYIYMCVRGEEAHTHTHTYRRHHNSTHTLHVHNAAACIGLSVLERPFHKSQTVCLCVCVCVFVQHNGKTRRTTHAHNIQSTCVHVCVCIYYKFQLWWMRYPSY